jgi:uncharacterized membrane protein YfcA
MSLHLIADPVFCAVAIPAVLLTGISKAGFGGALGGIAVPLLALFIAPGDAAGIMLPLLCFTDVSGLRPYLGKWDLPNARVLVPAGVAGVAIGALIFPWMSEQFIRVLIGAISVAFVVQGWWSGSALDATARPHSPAFGAACGALGGFTSFLAHAGGPPLMIHLLPQKLERTRFVATMNLYFLIINVVKLLPYALEGQLSARNFGSSLLLAPLVPLGVWIGMRLHHRVNELWFYRIARIALLLTGLQLIVQGLA